MLHEVGGVVILTGRPHPPHPSCSPQSIIWEHLQTQRVKPEYFKLNCDTRKTGRVLRVSSTHTRHDKHINNAAAVTSFNYDLQQRKKPWRFRRADGNKGHNAKMFLKRFSFIHVSLIDYFGESQFVVLSKPSWENVLSSWCLIMNVW